ncbi:hypothetical protein CK203_065793 [Vitis vinifera]|uniref:Uncharacterized protein n=1 Tax=Vitis vinifera TaxID=29760 RepID=A0A438G3R0_VITVI|nr:hypothetical protein CK203_065793 [Vitis vinifera]
MDGVQNDLSQKIDNVQYAISRLTNLNTMQEKGKFLLNLIKIPRVSMKWRLKRENLQSQTTSEDEFLRDEWLGFTFLRVREAR